MKKTSQHSLEVRKRALRMAAESRNDHPSVWTAVLSKIVFQAKRWALLLEQPSIASNRPSKRTPAVDIRPWAHSQQKVLPSALYPLFTQKGILTGRITLNIASGSFGELGRTLAKQFRMPTDSGEYSFELLVHPVAGHLYWVRWFDGIPSESAFASSQDDMACWNETNGPFAMRVQLSLQNGHFSLIGREKTSRKTKHILSAPVCYQTHIQANGGKFQLHASFSLPELGEILSYKAELRLRSALYHELHDWLRAWERRRPWECPMSDEEKADSMQAFTLALGAPAADELACIMAEFTCSRHWLTDTLEEFLRAYVNNFPQAAALALSIHCLRPPLIACIHLLGECRCAEAGESLLTLLQQPELERDVLVAMADAIAYTAGEGARAGLLQIQGMSQDPEVLHEVALMLDWLNRSAKPTD